jgi:bifunctional aspartokinase / homoserine dehydrogenase 1
LGQAKVLVKEISTMIVMKFGGTSVGNAERYREVARLLGSYLDRQPVAVISAMAGTTDWLLNTARALADGGRNPSATSHNAEKYVADFHTRNFEVIAAAIHNPEIRRQVETVVAAQIQLLLRLLTGVELLGELSPRSLDAVAAFGEKISVQLLAGALQDLGFKAQPISAEELILTDRTFQAARPQMEITTARCRSRLLPLVEDGVIPVVTGFIGATDDGITTTLGRDGTDFSASIVGASLDADEIWIWKEVDGVMTADPRLVPNARSLRRISYAEAGELTHFGAKVIHPMTVLPAIEKGIPIFIKNTFNPSFPGTRIDHAHEGADGVVKAVTSARNLALITVLGGGVLTVPGIAARTFAKVASQNVNVYMISHASSGHDLCLVVEKKAIPLVVPALRKEFERELEIKEIDAIEADPQIVTIAVVGAGMRGAPGVAGRLFSALGRKSINVMVIAQGSSELNISLIVSADDEQEALMTIHEEFLSLTGLGKTLSRSMTPPRAQS